MKQYAALNDTVYFWFAANDTSGSGGDGASPAADIRLAGAAADAAPVYSPTPVLLTHANYPAGAYEVAIAATAGNGFAANNTYAVFCTLAIDSQNPTGFIGSFDLKPVESNIIQIGDVAQSATDLKDFADTGYDPSAHRTQAQIKGMDAGVLTAVAIAGDAITNAKIAADAIGASEFAQAAADKVRASVCVTGDPANSIGKILYDKTGFSLSAAGIDSIFDEVVEGTLTFRQIQRIKLAALGGKSTGGGTTALKFRDNADGKDRISATVDNNNNRTAMTLDGT